MAILAQSLCCQSCSRSLNKYKKQQKKKSTYIFTIVSIIKVSLFFYIACLSIRTGSFEGLQHIPHCVSVGHTRRHGSHPAVPVVPLVILLQVCETVRPSTQICLMYKMLDELRINSSVLKVLMLHNFVSIFLCSKCDFAILSSVVINV